VRCEEVDLDALDMQAYVTTTTSSLGAAIIRLLSYHSVYTLNTLSTWSVAIRKYLRIDRLVNDCVEDSWYH